MAGRLRVRTGKGQKPGGQRKRSWEKTGADRKTLVSLTNKTNCHRQTENTGINTHRISGEDRRHLEGVETSTRTGETDQSVTVGQFFRCTASL